ncbi:DUF2786 domain-containing protein [Denitratisoma sp. agr-D3]
MEDKSSIIEKIKKCLALGKSSNEHEAAAALRQAQKLMELHGISDADMLSAGAEECCAKSGADSKPAKWETMLAGKIGEAFGCEVLFTSAHGHVLLGNRKPGLWSFIGCGTAPTIAQYAFEVLARQARKARKEHIDNRLKRCKRNAQVRRADLFSEGWVRGVGALISAFSGTEQNRLAIAAYMEKHYPNLRDLQSTDRNRGRGLRDYEFGDLNAGHISGRNAQLNHGVGSASSPLSLE